MRVIGNIFDEHNDSAGKSGIHNTNNKAPDKKKSTKYFTIDTTQQFGI